MIGRDVPEGGVMLLPERCPSCALADTILRREQLPAICMCGWLKTQVWSVVWCSAYKRASDKVLRVRIQQLNTLLSTSAKGGDDKNG